MPIHDWARVPPYAFADFYACWTASLSRGLQAGLEALGHYCLITPAALVDREIASGEPVGLTHPDPEGAMDEAAGRGYARRQHAVAVRRERDDRLVGLIQIVPPAVKAAEFPCRTFVANAANALRRGYHLLVIDLFPPPRATRPACTRRSGPNSAASR